MVPVGHGLLGPHATLVDSEDTAVADITELFLFAPSIAIAGGTNEILRNLLAEKTLGLPREPDPERDAPFDATQAGRDRAES